MSTKTILVIDDENVSAKVITEYLKAENYFVETFQKSEEAWQQLVTKPDKYALLIVDRIMPKLDAIQLLQRMHSHSELQHIPVIVMTGEADDIAQEEVMEAGAFALIFKPVAKQELLAITRAALVKNNSI